MKLNILFIAFLFSISTLFVSAQNGSTGSPFTSRMYFAWGYNKDYYSKSSIKISQPELGNNYELKNISGNDKVGWDKLFQRPLTIPQYNYRFGFFLKKNPSIGFEFSFDHTKYQLTPGQNAHLIGTVNGQSVDTNIIIQDSVFFWKLNNGANFFCFNVMKRYYIAGTKNGKIKLFNIFKAGIGPTVPHVENTLMGHKNKPHFQFGGWNAALEATYRLEVTNFLYIDLSNKVDYARYSGLRVYKGTAKQSFYTYEVIATLGIMLPYRKSSTVVEEPVKTN
jgi:hypothetical protein